MFDFSSVIGKKIEFSSVQSLLLMILKGEQLLSSKMLMKSSKS